MADDLIETLREEALYGNTHSGQILELIEGLQGQIRVIQSAAKYATKAYEQQIAVLRQKLEEKPPVWHDDIQSLQERDAIMTDRIEKLEAALREIDEWAEEQCYVGLRKLIRIALEGKDG